MNIGKTFKMLRTWRLKSQTEMAIKAGISVSYLSLIETNKKSPSKEIIKKLAKSLGISEDTFIFISLNVPSELDKKEQQVFKQLQLRVKTDLII